MDKMSPRIEASYPSTFHGWTATCAASVFDPPPIDIFTYDLYLFIVILLKSVHSACHRLLLSKWTMIWGLLHKPIMYCIYKLNVKIQVFVKLWHNQYMHISLTKSLQELKPLIISSQHPDPKSICGHSRRRWRKSESIFNNLSFRIRLAEQLTQSWHGDTHTDTPVITHYSSYFHINSESRLADSVLLLLQQLLCTCRYRGQSRRRSFEQWAQWILP